MAKHRKTGELKRWFPVALQTRVAAAVALFPLLNMILLAILETAKEYEVYLPKTLFIVLNGTLLAVAGVSALFARIAAIPGLIQWIEEYWNIPASSAQEDHK